MAVTAISSLTFAALTIGKWQFDDATIQHILYATMVSAFGGFGVALLPWGEKSWNWGGFVKLILLGALVGPPTYSALNDHRLAFIGEFKPWVILGTGAVAYPLFIGLRDGGPKRLFTWVLRLRGPIPIPPPPPDPPARAQGNMTEGGS